MARIVSVGVGTRTELQIGGRTATSGIAKPPVAGSVHVGRLGLAGDVVVDTRHHGGVDQAVYLYRAEDYAWWSAELGRALPPGLFGENAVVEGLGALRVGDRLRTEGVELELTAPRIPCATLTAAVGVPEFAKRFREAARTGVYARVVQEGPLQAGDAVEHIPSEHIPIAELFALWYAPDPDAVRRALDAPVAHRVREKLERWLSRDAPPAP